jgi:MFS transporter, ACS family, solute carrier family 17 (sodium-dependent inorganic phosphate cotransporter), other
MYIADCIPQRHIMSIMGFLAIVNAYTMRVSLSVAIVQMVGSSSSNNSDPNACPFPPNDGEEEVEVHLGVFLSENIFII